jgi:hypothetical protein
MHTLDGARQVRAKALLMTLLIAMAIVEAQHTRKLQKSNSASPSGDVRVWKHCSPRNFAKQAIAHAEGRAEKRGRGGEHPRLELPMLIIMQVRFKIMDTSFGFQNDPGEGSPQTLDIKDDKHSYHK